MSDITEIQESGSLTETPETPKVKLSFEIKGYVDLSKVDFNGTSNLAPIPALDDFESKINHQINTNNNIDQETVKSTNERLDNIEKGLDRIEEIKAELEAQLNNAYNIRLVKFKSDKQNGYRVYSDGYCEQW